MSELKPCPICGGTLKIYSPEDWKPTFYDFDSGGDPTLITMAIMVLILAFVTNLSTNTAAAAALIPVTLALFPGNTLVFVMVCKAINLSYITVYGNSCLAVASGYGLKQRDLAKYGLPVVILAIIGYLAYYAVAGMVI